MLNKDLKFVIENQNLRIESKDSVERLLSHMYHIDASDLFIYTDEPVMCKVHGRLYPLTTRSLQIQEINNLISVISGTSSVSQLGSMNPIDVSYAIKNRETNGEKPLVKNLRYRINAVGSLVNGRNGITISVRLLATELKRAHELGVDQELIDAVLNSKQGLFVVAGATGQGKSTTMASLLTEVMVQPNADEIIVTVESPVEYVYDSLDKPSSIITQLEVGRNVRSFGEGVRNAMRMTPTSIVVGEIRDLETGDACLEASNTGHFVYGTIHANRVDAIPDRFLSFFSTDAEKEKAKFSLITESKILMSQRLALTTDGKRKPIREYLILDRQISEFLLTNQAHISQTIKEAVKKWGKPMYEDVNKLHSDGLLSDQDKRIFDLEFKSEI